MRISLLIGACLLASGCATSKVTQAQKKDIYSKAYNRGWEDASQFCVEGADQGQQTGASEVGTALAVPGEEPERIIGISDHLLVPWERMRE